ncbi:unnamed protein product [Chrysoparadoxa australica]
MDRAVTPFLSPSSSSACRGALMGSQASKGRLNILSSHAEELKDKSFEEVSEVYRSFCSIYGPAKFTLDKEEFSEIFGQLLDDPEDHFRMLAREKEHINAQDMFAAAFVLSKDAYRGIDSKMNKLFLMFDFDRSSCMNEVEIELMMESTIHGIAKVCQASVPEDTSDELHLIIVKLFKDMRRCMETEDITLQELKTWASSQSSVLNYLSSITSCRMVLQARRMIHEQIAAVMEKFDAMQRSGGVTPARAAELLKMHTGAPPTKHEVAQMVDILTCGNTLKTVDRESFLASQLPWVAFNVVDEDESMGVDSNELKALLWLMQEDSDAEPTLSVVKRAMDEIDLDKGGTISRQEWVEYNTVRDPTSHRVGFAREIMELFRKYDHDHGGTISTDEMCCMVADTVRGEVARLEMQGMKLRPCMQQVLDQLVVDTSSDLLAHMGLGNSGVVDWAAFKNRQGMIHGKFQSLKGYIAEAAMCGPGPAK